MLRYLCLTVTDKIAAPAVDPIHLFRVHSMSPATARISHVLWLSSLRNNMLDTLRSSKYMPIRVKRLLIPDAFARFEVVLRSALKKKGIIDFRVLLGRVRAAV